MLIFIEDGVYTNFKIGIDGDVLNIIPILISPICIKDVEKIEILSYDVFGCNIALKYLHLSKSFKDIHLRHIYLKGTFHESAVTDHSNPFSTIVFENLTSCKNYINLAIPLCCLEVNLYDLIDVKCFKCFTSSYNLIEALSALKLRLKNTLIPRVPIEATLHNIRKLSSMLEKIVSRISRILNGKVIGLITDIENIKLYVPLSVKNSINDIVDICDVVYDINKCLIYFVQDELIDNLFKFVEKNLIRVK